MKEQGKHVKHYFYKMLFCLLGTVCLAGCSDKDVSGMNEANDANKVKMIFNVMLPNGQSSRSQTNTPGDKDYVTSEDGTEIGKDYENHVGEVLLVLADSDDKCLLSRIAVVVKGGNAEHWEVETKASDIAGFGAVKVYVFCNPSSALKNMSTGTDLKALSYTLQEDNADDPAWNTSEKGHFFMSNAVAHNFDFTNDTATDNIYDLGTVKVERSVARFDYKQKAKDNLYDIVIKPEETSSTKESQKDPEFSGIQIKLTDVALVNLSKNFYYLRRVSNNGLNDKATICGVEISNNYVVDTDAQEKSSYKKADTWKTGNFFYNLENTKEWRNSFTSLSTITGEKEDNDDSWNNPDKHGNYYIWRYATENTIPQPDTQQMNGISTGVVFKAQIVVDESATTGLAAKIKEYASKSYKVYAFKGRLYGTWKDVYNAAIAGNATLYAAYEKVEKKEMTLREAGFSVYYPQYLDKNDKTKIGYQAVYYYWNRHNDNGRTTGDNHMGPMEFAVVRNNVYKLCVEDIYTFGYPFNDPDDPDKPDPTDPDPENPDPEDPDDPDPDPETPDPETPDEPDPDDDPDVTFKVSVQVLPWVVRINHIEF